MLRPFLRALFQRWYPSLANDDQGGQLEERLTKIDRPA